MIQNKSGFFDKKDNPVEKEVHSMGCGSGACDNNCSFIIFLILILLLLGGWDY